MFNFNLNLCYMLCFIVLGTSNITCAPTGPPAPPAPKVTFHDAVAQKCPQVKVIPNTLFDSCSNWEKISQVTTLTDANKKEVSCWLFYNAYTLYCKHTQLNTTEIISGRIYDLNLVCDNLDVIPKELDANNSLHKIISTPEDCKKLCSDEVGLVTSLCSMSFFYNNHTNPTKKSDHLLHVVPNKLGETHKDAQVQAKDPQQAINVPPESAVKKSKIATNKTDQSNQNVGPQGKDDPASESKAAVKDNTNNEVVAPSQKKVVNETNIPEDKTSISKKANPPESVANEDNTNKQKNSVDVKEASQPKASDTENNVKKGPSQDKPPESGNNAVPNVPPPDTGANLNESPVQKPEEEVSADKGPSDKPSDNNDMINDTEDIDDGQISDGQQPEVDPKEQSNLNPQEKPKPAINDDTGPVNYSTEMDGDSYFFTYFMLLCVIFIVGYVCYHNKQKILALILEGRRGKRQYRGKRPNSANYHKLDSNLEEAITSSCNKNTNNVIY